MLVVPVAAAAVVMVVVLAPSEVGVKEGMGKGEEGRDWW